MRSKRSYRSHKRNYISHKRSYKRRVIRAALLDKMIDSSHTSAGLSIIPGLLAGYTSHKIIDDGSKTSVLPMTIGLLTYLISHYYLSDYLTRDEAKYYNKFMTKRFVKRMRSNKRHR